MFDVTFNEILLNIIRELKKTFFLPISILLSNKLNSPRNFDVSFYLTLHSLSCYLCLFSIQNINSNAFGYRKFYLLSCGLLYTRGDFKSYIWVFEWKCLPRMEFSDLKFLSCESCHFKLFMIQCGTKLFLHEWRRKLLRDFIKLRI